MREALFQELWRLMDAEEPAVVVTRVAGEGTGAQLLVPAGGTPLGDLGGDELNAAAAAGAEELLAAGSSRRRELPEGPGGAADLFFDVLLPRPRLVLIGAGHVAVPLVTMAGAAGYQTIVVDPRTAFASPERFAHADRLIPRWPKEAMEEVTLSSSTCVAVLSHDLKLDVPALRAVLRSPVRYVGALGSKKTHAKRLEALRAEGFSDQELGRIHAPIGLDLGGRSPEEIALAILAEMVASGHGRALRPA